MVQASSGIAPRSDLRAFSVRWAFTVPGLGSGIPETGRVLGSTGRRVPVLSNLAGQPDPVFAGALRYNRRILGLAAKYGDMSGIGRGGLTPVETKAALGLGGVYAVRMLGLFMVMPVFAVYADEFGEVTPILIGLAIGIYGLTQAALQVPLGMLSDRLGRKPVIVGGLLVFAAGSVIAALSSGVYGVIVGRALQGAGAIAAALMALAADLTREESRTRVMAIIGLSIGGAFSVALVAGPVIHDWVGVRGIFWTTAALALGAVVIVVGLVPSPVTQRLHRDAGVVRSALEAVIRDRELLRLDAGIFVLHAALTANFVVLPTLIRDRIGIPVDQHWWLYLPVLGMSFFLMLPFIIVGEKRRILKPVLIGAVAVLLLGEWSLTTAGDGVWSVILPLLAFFAAFNLLEASLPSLVAKYSPPDKKGTAMGLYATGQFLGAFSGGAAGGILAQMGGSDAVFVGGSVAIAGWWLLVLTMKEPRYLSSYLLNVGSLDGRDADALMVRLSGVTGVAEAVVIPEDGVAYLKVDRRALDETALRELVPVSA